VAWNSLWDGLHDLSSTGSTFRLDVHYSVDTSVLSAAQ